MALNCSGANDPKRTSRGGRLVIQVLPKDTKRQANQTTASSHTINKTAIPFRKRHLTNTEPEMIYPIANLIASISIFAGNGLCKNAMPPASTA